jgi:glycosyltransferase involved in cell wall biosynthesis
MKILNVNMTLDPITGGGTAERILQISRALVKSGHQCTILTTGTGLSPDYIRNCEKSGFGVVALPFLWKRFYVPKPSRRLIRNLVENSDVVQLMNHWTLLNALVFHYVRHFRKPYVVCPAGGLPIFGRSKIFKGIYNRILGKRIIRQANACVAISPIEIPDFKTYGVREDMISIIPNGVEPEEFIQKNAQGFRLKYGLPNVPFILFMGRLNTIKGPDLLLEAFSRVIRAEGLPHHLVFAGPDGGMRHDLQMRCVREGVENRVHFLGYVGGRDKSHAYHAAELLVIPSRQEAMSIVVLEAGITGTPVLITDQCGFNDVSVVNGGIVVPASVDGIQKGLIEILNDTEKRHSMGRNLKKYVEDNFTWKIAMEKYLQLFRMILERG